MPRNAFRCIDECTKWVYSPFKLQSKTHNRGQVYSGQVYSGQAYGVQVDSVQVDSVQVDSVQVPTGLLIVLGLPGVRTICAARK
ncbi:hypothetical protein E4U38_003446 [Claviceps purpurea]|nr:hypothetical protein E4U38_003446 [Claviceps purpurea]